MDCESVVVLPPDVIDLALRKTLVTGQSNTPAPGQKVCYNIEVFNQCGQPVTDIVICDYAPAGLVLDDSSATEWVNNGNGAFICTIPGPLAPGSSQSIRICFKVADNAVPGTVITNCAEICAAKDELGHPAVDSDSTFDSNPNNDGRVTNDAYNSENFDEDDHDCEPITVGQPNVTDLALRNTLAPGQTASVVPNGLVTLTIEVFNQGSLPVTNVTIADCLPAGFTIEDPAWTQLFGTTYGRMIPGTLAPGMSTKVNITMRAGTTTGEVRNVAEVLNAKDSSAVYIYSDVDSTYDSVCTNDGIVVDDELNNALGDEDDNDIQLLTVQPTGSIGSLVWKDANDNGLKDANEVGLDGVVLTLCDQAGNPIDADPLTAGVQPKTTTTSGGGLYSFTDLVPGSYIVKIATPPAEYPSSSTGADTADNQVDNNDNGIQAVKGSAITSPIIAIVSGENDLTIDFGLVPAKPSTFGLWKNQNALGGQNGALQNPDGDTLSNLLEYVSCTDPASGLGNCRIDIVVQPSGQIDLKFRRVLGLTDVTYTLEGAGALALLTPTTFAPITNLSMSSVNNGDGTETVTYANLEAAGAAFADGDGFFRIKVGLDTNGDNTPDMSDYFDVVGYTDIEHPGDISGPNSTVTHQCTTFSMPYLLCEIFSGVVDGNSVNTLNLATSVGSGSLIASLDAAKSYYVEVIDGPQEGHRFAINRATTTATTLGINTTSTDNTKALTTSLLNGAHVVIREHHTINSLFPPAGLLAGNSTGNADYIVTYKDGEWVTFWLLDMGPNGKRWVKDGDVTLADYGSRTVPPSEGIYFHRQALSITVARSGHVRSNDFATPLRVGSSLIASGYPLDQSYASRGMTIPAGFHGGVEVPHADQVLIWMGDTIPGRTNYTTDWLLDGGAPYQYWTSAEDSSITNRNAVKVFKGSRAAVHTSVNGLPTFVVPAQWSPAP